MIEHYTIYMISITFVIYIMIGIVTNAKDTKSFFVADQGIPTIANGAAIAADWMSAGSFYIYGWTYRFLRL